MGSHERIIRKKEATASAIIQAAMVLLVKDGEDGISMRLIAEKIEYTAPIIYTYFKDKDAVLTELAALGYIKLNQNIKRLLKNHKEKFERISEVVLCIVEFALKNNQLYKLMSRLALKEPTSLEKIPEVQTFIQILYSEIQGYTASGNQEVVSIEKFYTTMALTHGIISMCYLYPDYNKMQKKDMVLRLMRCIIM